MWFSYRCLNMPSLVSYSFSWLFWRFDINFALYIMLVIWPWLERGYTGLLIQLQFMYIDNSYNYYHTAATFILTLLLWSSFGCWDNAFESIVRNIYPCCWRCSLRKACTTRWSLFCNIWAVYFCFLFRYLMVCIGACSHTKLD